MTRLWILPVLGLLVVFALACSSDEDVPNSTSASPSGASPSDTLPLASTVPDDWPTFTDPDGRFTLRYPLGWFPSEDEISSVDPSTSPDGSTEWILLELNVSPDDGGGGCGVLKYDSTTGEVSPHPNATTVQLGSISAWKIVRDEDDPQLHHPYTRIEAVSVIYNGYCFNIPAYFTQQDPDVNVFSQIISTFQFTSN
jgi:hypothetical protein